MRKSQLNDTCRMYRRLNSIEPIGFQVRDANGNAINLSGRTLSISGWNMDTGALEFSGASVSIIDAANGKVSWTPDSSHVDEEKDIALVIQDDTNRQWPWDGARMILEVRPAWEGQYG